MKSLPLNYLQLEHLDKETRSYNNKLLFHYSIISIPKLFIQLSVHNDYRRNEAGKIILGAVTYYLDLKLNEKLLEDHLKLNLLQENMEST